MRSSIRVASSKKRMLFLSLLILLLCLSVGYAALSEKLKINTIAKIDSNIWDVHFENVRVSEGSIEGTPIIGSDKTSLSLSFTIGEPGDFYEFYVDVVNRGAIDAKVESLVSTTLTETQSHYLTFHVTYEDGVDIKKGDTLHIGESDRIKVLIQFNRSINVEELPSKGETINLECQINYVQDEGTGSPRKRKVLASVLSSVAESDANINFGAISSDTNGKGVYKLTKIERDGEPIYYYRGDVKNNNVIYVGFCWKMLRTTSTGGVKLIYNGISNNGVCNNTGERAEIGKSVYNTEQNDVKYVGYMYDNNTKNSAIKEVVDAWFANHLILFQDYLEDTPFYNERDYIEETGYQIINFAPRQRLYGLGGDSSNTTIKLGATNGSDIFIVSSDKGNGALTYPVGLLTSDEIVLAGGKGWASNGEGVNREYYLCSSSAYWSISPSYVTSSYISRTFVLGENGDIGNLPVSTNSAGVRPVISLKPSTVYASGDGTSNNPYLV